MGKALYREYRPKTLSEVVGQEHITTALAHALKSGNISHAYLFTGPHGVGKTSIARILAHEVNGLPYDDTTAYLDIIEIDAASNRRIEEIRDLRDKVHITPTQAKYKVYIIDEVHMLTREAFNALLKTLEEPPPHVIFILATTEAHKLPETIISRCLRFSFKPIDQQQVVTHLRQIAQAEKINVDDAALALIAQHGEGSFRDSISLLDQASNTGEAITLETVRSLLGIAPAEVITQLIDILAAGTPKQLLELLDSLRQRGLHAPALAKQLTSYLRHTFAQSNHDITTSSLAMLKLMHELIDVPASSDPETLLELTLLETVFAHANVIEEPARAPSNTPVAVLPQPDVPFEPTPAPSEIEASTSEPKPSVPKPAKAASAATDLSQFWPEVLASLKQSHNTLYGVVRMAEPTLVDGVLTLGFRFPFHQKRVNEAKNKRVIIELVQTHSGQTITLECVLQTADNPTPKIAESLDSAVHPVVKNDTIDTISNIFGSVELLDS